MASALDEFPFYLELDRTTPQHSDRPLELAHLDHTQLNIELTCSCTGQNLGKPWLTLLTDSFSRRTLAIFLTFDPPSYRSCMMVLRECIRRCRRFPQFLLLNGGDEFDVAYFEPIQMQFWFTTMLRPPKRRRGNSSVSERLFGCSSAELIQSLTSKTPPEKRERKARGEGATQLRQWTLPQIAELLYKWSYETHDVASHPALGTSPRQAFEQGIKYTGTRSHCEMAYDQDFFLRTLPMIKPEQAKTRYYQGERPHHIRFLSSLYNTHVEQQQAQIHYDPYNVGLTFTYLNNQWASFMSDYHDILRGHSEQEFALAIELYQNRQTQSIQSAISLKDVADILSADKPTEAIQTQRLKDHEMRSALARAC